MKKFCFIKRNRGMTYVELIVVLSIFSVMSSVVIYNYSDFQAKVDAKNLASDIALKIVESQKSATGGVLPLSGYSESWKPSYGVFFNLQGDSFPISNNNAFISFIDLNNNHFFDDSDCTGECLEKIAITKSNIFIEKIEGYNGSTPTAITGPINITFTRPDSRAVFNESEGSDDSFDYLQISVKSVNGQGAVIKVYQSGRIQVN